VRIWGVEGFASANNEPHPVRRTNAMITFFMVFKVKRPRPCRGAGENSVGSLLGDAGALLSETGDHPDRQRADREGHEREKDRGNGRGDARDGGHGRADISIVGSVGGGGTGDEAEADDDLRGVLLDVVDELHGLFFAGPVGSNRSRGIKKGNPRGSQSPRVPRPERPH
jgi:hypothetical protein